VFEDEVRTRTVWYVYYETGDVSNPFGKLRASIIVKDEGEGDDYDWYRGLAFTYWGLAQSVIGLAPSEKWPEEYGWNPGNDPPPEGYEKLALREFRYHPNPRGRFMTRDLDPNDQEWQWSTVGPEHWTDYDIPMPNADFDVTFDLQGNPVVGQQMRYLEGFGLPAQQTVSTGATQYLHGDLIRSTNLLTDGNGAAVATTAYTAFGELVTGYSELATRYQYGGGWGYESGGFGDDPGLLVLNGAEGTVPITLMHVGHRWYDPSIGRFLQRDPIGIDGGLNVYLYGAANPTIAVDPDGEWILLAVRGIIRGGKWVWQGGKWVWKTGKSIRITRPKTGGFWQPAHHRFPIIGERRHFQCQVYLKGKRKAGITIRIPY